MAKSMESDPLKCSMNVVARHLMLLEVGMPVCLAAVLMGSLFSHAMHAEYQQKIDRLFKYYQTKAAILHLPVGEMMMKKKKQKQKQKPKEEITMGCYNVMVLDVKYKQMHYFHLVCGTLSSNLATIRLLWALLSYC